MSRHLARVTLLAAVAGCTVYNAPTVTEVPRPSRTDSVVVHSPVKAHLIDGSTVVYRGAILIQRDTIRALADGTAYRYGLTLTDSTPAAALPLDQVVGMESYQNSVNGLASAVYTLVGIAGGALVGGALAVAIFGSCPTVYADSAGSAVLEAEGFSYSIAPLFEARDVDRLRTRPDAAGTLRLEIRNEALETHYINQLGLLEVRHAANEVALPDGSGHPLVVTNLVFSGSARDRAGRDVRSVLLAADGVAYHTDARTIEHASAADLTDHVDLSFPVTPGSDSVALVFRMRNSLLNTVLLYELMLAEPGARALDWLGHDLQEIGPVARLGRWYAEHMGIRVGVWERNGFREVSRIPDTGPVAWKDVAVLVPAPASGDTLRVRLEFVADNWRIDQVRLALNARHAPKISALEPQEVLGADDRADTSALAGLRAVDTRYLVTMPGQRFTIRFHTGPTPTDSARTFFLVSEGFYTEWLRSVWLRGVHPASAFQPSNDALVEALRRWRAKRVDFERRFAETRVPVR